MSYLRSVARFKFSAEKSSASVRARDASCVLSQGLCGLLFHTFPLDNTHVTLGQTYADSQKQELTMNKC